LKGTARRPMRSYYFCHDYLCLLRRNRCGAIHRLVGLGEFWRTAERRDFPFGFPFLARSPQSPAKPIWSIPLKERHPTRHSQLMTIPGGLFFPLSFFFSASLLIGDRLNHMGTACPRFWGTRRWTNGNPDRLPRRQPRQTSVGVFAPNL